MLAFASINSYANPPHTPWYWRWLPMWLQPGERMYQPDIIKWGPIDLSDPG